MRPAIARSRGTIFLRIPAKWGSCNKIDVRLNKNA
jgi:hypothetical protein